MTYAEMKNNLKPNSFIIAPDGTPSAPVKAGDKVTAVIYDVTGHPITAARNWGKVYTIKEENGQLGIDWNDKDAKEIYGAFCPFTAFAYNVEFTIVK